MINLQEVRNKGMDELRCLPIWDVLYWHKGVCRTKGIFIENKFLHGEFYRERPASDSWDELFIGSDFGCVDETMKNCSIVPQWVELPCNICRIHCMQTVANYWSARKSRFEFNDKCN